jgi:hypothetical protein
MTFENGYIYNSVYRKQTRHLSLPLSIGNKNPCVYRVIMPTMEILVVSFSPISSVTNRNRPLRLDTLKVKNKILYDLLE